MPGGSQRLRHACRVEVRDFTGREGWGKFNALCCAMDGYTYLKSIHIQNLPDGDTYPESTTAMLSTPS